MGSYAGRSGTHLRKALTVAGVPTIGSPGGFITGDVYFVDPGAGSDGHDGKSRNSAFKTTQAGINACTASNGDVIIRMRGGEAVTSTVNFNKSGVTIVADVSGINPLMNGEYYSIYSTTLTADPVAIVTAPTTIIGLGFAGADAGTTFWSGAALLIGGDADATPVGVRIAGCRFPKWGLDNRIGIAVEGSTDCLIEECCFEGVGSALAQGIYVQGATQNITIRNNWFRQCTYGIAFGAFAGGGPHCFIHGNHFEDGKVLSCANAATGVLSDNWCEGLTDTGSYSDTVDNHNTQGLVFSGQHYFE